MMSVILVFFLVCQVLWKFSRAAFGRIYQNDMDKAIMSTGRLFGRERCIAGFSLVEMSVVVAVLVALMAAGVGVVSNTGADARRTGTDLVIGLVEQARTIAISTRSHVVIAVAEPGDLDVSDGLCRLGLFRVGEWPREAHELIECRQLRRWQALPTGILLLGGDADDAPNPLHGKEIEIVCTEPKPLKVKSHVLVFNPQGGLVLPQGSSPAVIRIADGHYRDGVHVPRRRGGDGSIRESRLKIGRYTGRSYRVD